MPRPKKTRFVSAYPAIAAFVPTGVTVSGEVFMSVEELESIRLSDFEHLDQETAANLMKVSRHTYGRILANARSILAEAVITGKSLKIEGGVYEFRGMGRRRHRRGGKGQGRGQGKGRGAGYDQGRQS
jgi:predicted DNA-binding protein (UPF0251 family)